ncbi:MAG: class I SAM-dependent methyltransferase [Acetobacteraceae bacterium]|nr:class I SAM-dependent methyltransferase [Acetobacteraceae bacterium]
MTRPDDEDPADTRDDAFDPDWLALREPYDALARSEALAAALIARLPARPRLIDLGAGTGSLLRWLAPRIGRAQAWTLVDSDRALMEEAFDTIAGRAEAIGLKATMPNRRTLLVHARGGAWRVEALHADLAEAPRNLPLQGADAVLCSALCDLVSAAWIERMAAALRVPFYAALSVDGRDRFWPPHPADGAVARAFRRDQARDKGFGGPALGPAAPAAIARAFAARGFMVRSAASDWVARARGGRFLDVPIPPGHATGFLRYVVLGHVAAARQPMRGRGGLTGWGLARLEQVDARRLSVRIGHRDVLALPPERRR